MLCMTRIDERDASELSNEKMLTDPWFHYILSKRARYVPKKCTKGRGAKLNS